MEAAEYKTNMLKRQQEQEQLRSSISQSRTATQMQQIKVMEARQKSMGAMPNPFGGGMGMGNMGAAPKMPSMKEAWGINPLNPMASMQPEKPKVKVVYRTKKHKRRK